MEFFPRLPPSTRPTAQAGTLPAPRGGINSVMSLASMTPEDAILTVNIDSSTYGLRVRPGYSEYATNFTGDSTKSIIPFTGSSANGQNDRLFAATSDGIFDISDSTEAPTKVVDFPIKSSDAGWCIFVQVVNDNGDHVLLVTDGANGLHRYLESTGLWTKPVVTGPTGVLVFCTVWKQRVWFIEENSTSAWYTDIGTFSGNATEFNFGNKFRYGGNLVALYSWTLDAGDGADDYLVSVSSAGDVVVYSGTDPSSPNTFGQIGRWFIGALPAGRRVGSQFGGDLLLLSVYGLISMQDLLRGQNPFTNEASLSWKVQGFLSDLMRLTRTVLGWEVKLHPSLSRIIVSAPKVVAQPFRQFVYDVELEAWSIWEGVPILTSESYKGDIYFGSLSAQVWTLSGHLDNVHITPQEQNGIYLFGYTYGVGSAPFQLGDRVVGLTSGAEGTVMSITPLYLGISAVVGTFVVGETLEGPTSPAPLLIATATNGPALSTLGALVTSRDAITWTARTLPAGFFPVGVACSTSRNEVLALESTGSIVRSVDGETWTLLTNDIGNRAWTYITRSDELGLYVAIGNDSGGGSGQRVATSPDGVTWTPRTISALVWRSVNWLPYRQQFVACGLNNSTTPFRLSSDGITWSAATAMGVAETCANAAESEDGVVSFFTPDNNRTYHTTDFTTYTQVATITSQQWGAYNEDFDLFCTSSNAIGGIYTAPGAAGSPWTLRSGDAAAIGCISITSWSGGAFVALRHVAGGIVVPHILYSIDAVTFVDITPAAFVSTMSYRDIMEASLFAVPTAEITSITLNPTDKLPRQIDWRGLTAYTALGLPEMWKSIGFIRPQFISALVPQFQAKAKYDYDLEELTTVLSNSPYGGGTWDASDWDLAVWGGTPLSRLIPPRGADGMGRMVAVSWAGKSQSETVLVSFGLIFNQGGLGI